MNNSHLPIVSFSLLRLRARKRSALKRMPISFVSENLVCDFLNIVFWDGVPGRISSSEPSGSSSVELDQSDGGSSSVSDSSLM